MSNFDPAMIEALASAWASIDGKLDKFYAGKGKPIEDQPGGHYDGYICEAEEMAARLLKRGFIITPSGQKPVMSDDRCDLQKLCQAIVDHTGGDGFWIGEILLDTIKRETGYKYEPAVYQEELRGTADMEGDRG